MSLIQVKAMAHRLMKGDCLELLPTMEAGSIDCVLSDPPFGTTQCAWDSIIPLEPLWRELKRIIKPHGAIVLMAGQPFTSALVMSNPRWFKYNWVWDKVNRVSGFLDAARRPLKTTEDILVFSDGSVTYNPQMERGTPYTTNRTGEKYRADVHGHIKERTTTVNDGQRYPRNIIQIKGDVPEIHGEHPTQKPVALMEYLVRTYTNPGETVLDFCMGVGTTGVAALRSGRNFIGMELDADYFTIADKRISDAASFGPLFADVAKCEAPTLFSHAEPEKDS